MSEFSENLRFERSLAALAMVSSMSAAAWSGGGIAADPPTVAIVATGGGHSRLCSTNKLVGPGKAARNFPGGRGSWTPT
jgi:hypothetical protein